MNHLSTTHHNQQGFTFIELAVAVAIVSVVLLAVLGLQNFVLQQQEFTVTSYLSVETANRAIEIMVKELRNSRNGENGSYILQTVNDQEIIFFANADNDPAMERIHYFLDGTELKKGVINPTSYPISYPVTTETIEVVAESVRNGSQPLFYYYNGDWPSDTTNNPLVSAQRLLNTRLVEVFLTVNVNENDLKQDYEIRSQAQIRTLKDNL